MIGTIAKAAGVAALAVGLATPALAANGAHASGTRASTKGGGSSGYAPASGRPAPLCAPPAPAGPGTAPGTGNTASSTACVRGVVVSVNNGALSVILNRPPAAPPSTSNTTPAAVTPITPTAVTVDSTTAYTLTGRLTSGQASLGAIGPGTTIDVAGTYDSNGILTARAIDVIPASVDGLVIAVGNNSFTVAAQSGARTVDVTSSTTYTTTPTTTSTVSFGSLAVGVSVYAEGTSNADGSLNALAVGIGGPGGRGHGPRGAFGRVPAGPHGHKGRRGGPPAPAKGTNKPAPSRPATK